MNVQKSVADSSEPVLCEDCQTFYGSKNTNWLCSSCFKKGKKQAKVEVTLEKAPTECQQVPEAKVDQKEEKKEEKVEVVQVDRKRCFTCKKKVGLLGIECKCSFVFCNGHRMPEDHDCTFNHKAKGRKELQNKVFKVDNGKIAHI